MSWEFGQRYRVNAVPGQVAIKTLPSNGTQLVEVMCEVKSGPMATRRLAYKGYINTLDNASKTYADLKTMGWRGTKWGDWTGLGQGRDFEMACMREDALNGQVFPKFAFPRALREVDRTYESTAKDVDNLNKSFNLEDLAALEEAKAFDGRGRTAADADSFPPDDGR
jgi:hypothetical protein